MACCIQECFCIYHYLIRWPGGALLVSYMCIRWRRVRVTTLPLNCLDEQLRSGVWLHMYTQLTYHEVKALAPVLANLLKENRSSSVHVFHKWQVHVGGTLPKPQFGLNLTYR
jgi:hypothetical protein